MTDQLPADPSSRSRLLRFLVPVLIAHGLLLASLPYWPDSPPPGQHSMDVQLAPITTDAAAKADDGKPPPAPAPAPIPVAAPATPAQTKPAAPPVTPQPPPLARPPAKAPAVAIAPAPAPAAQQATEPAPPTPNPSAADADQARTDTASAAAPAATAGDTDWRDDYRQGLRAALARHHSYPDRARRFGLSGEVRVGFSIARDGRFDDIRLVHSSSVDLLDQAALTTVRRLGSFRPLPVGYSEDSWAVEVPLVYRLD